MKWKDDPPLDAWPQTLAATEIAAARTPDNTAIWVGLAQSAANLGREPEALGSLIAATARIPGNAALHRATARLLHALDRFEKAQVYLDEALRINPEDRAARLLNFLLLLKTGRWGDAAD